jgi:hypothetical protein
MASSRRFLPRRPQPNPFTLSREFAPDLMCIVQGLVGGPTGVSSGSFVERVVHQGKWRTIMTDQQDPEARPTDETRLGSGLNRYMRRADGSLGTLPVVIALAIVVILGFLLLNRAVDPSINTGASDTRTTNPAGTFKWLEGGQSSCGIVCRAAGGGYEAMSSGTYTNGNDFLICAANAHGEGNRAGFNLEPDWSNRCYVAHTVEEAYKDYFCLCRRTSY